MRMGTTLLSHTAQFPSSKICAQQAVETNYFFLRGRDLDATAPFADLSTLS
jgi:hypothetical protein